MLPKPLRRVFFKPNPAGERQAFRQVQVRNIATGQTRVVDRPLSPQQAFIRTGKRVRELRNNGVPINARRAGEAGTKRLGERFLSNVWHNSAKEVERSGGRLRMPLPTFKQRLNGGRLPANDRAVVEQQLQFALKVFGRGLSSEARQDVIRRVREKVPGRILAVSNALRMEGKHDLESLRANGKDLNEYFRGKGAFAQSTGEKGTMYYGITNDKSGRVHLAKGFTADRQSTVTPIHETVHVLKSLGVIKVDAPIAYAADRLYGLEKGILKVEKGRKPPTPQEFNWTSESEPDVASERIGNRLGQWAFQSLPVGKR